MDTESLPSACVICGNDVYDPGSPRQRWLAEYRLICFDPAGTLVTGVGLCDEMFGYLNIPADPSLRYNQARAQQTEWLDVNHVISGECYCRHGFLLHDSCWSLLKKMFQPQEIPLTRLLEVIASFPGQVLLDWGRRYLPDWDGAMNNMRDDDASDYDNQDDASDNATDDANSYISADSMEWIDWACEGRFDPDYDHNPYNLAEIPRLLGTGLRAFEHRLRSSTQAVDCFARLPWEIREMIAKNLTTRDTFRLRLASRSFYPIVQSLSFWKSRFEPGGEADHIFGPTASNDARHWMKLFKIRRASPGLRNRSRIWQLIKLIAQLTGLQLKAPNGSDGDDEDFADLEWTTVSSNIQDLEMRPFFGHFMTGCRTAGTQFALVPSNLCGIAFSIACVANIDYISGIRLVTTDGRSQCLGYRNYDKEVFNTVTELKGFVSVLGPQGINAIQVVVKDGTVSEWVGRPRGPLKTERLATFQSVKALQVQFDGFKLVRLGVSGSRHSSPPVGTKTAQDELVRQTAIWRRKIPDSNLYLNGASFVGQSPPQESYRYMTWMHFGRPAGSRLGAVTGFRVYFNDVVDCLEIEYDESRCLYAPCTLGRRPWICPHHGPHTLKQFKIDGAGGEVIQTVAVTLNQFAPGDTNFRENGTVRSIKITTNHSRSFKAGKMKKGATWRSLKIAPGTTVTGFYAYAPEKIQRGKYGFEGLGVISEKIEKTGRRITERSSGKEPSEGMKRRYLTGG